MPIPAWPTGLIYEPKKDGFEPLKPIESTARSDNPKGQGQERKRFLAKYHTYGVTWCFDADQLRAFQMFYKDSLNNGLRHFTMPVWTTRGYETHTVRFTEPYQQKGTGYNWFDVTAKLYVRTAPSFREPV